MEPSKKNWTYKSLVVILSSLFLLEVYDLVQKSRFNYDLIQDNTKVQKLPHLETYNVQNVYVLVEPVEQVQELSMENATPNGEVDIEDGEVEVQTEENKTRRRRHRHHHRRHRGTHAAEGVDSNRDAPRRPRRTQSKNADTTEDQALPEAHGNEAELNLGSEHLDTKSEGRRQRGRRHRLHGRERRRGMGRRRHRRHGHPRHLRSMTPTKTITDIFEKALTQSMGLSSAPRWSRMLRSFTKRPSKTAVFDIARKQVLGTSKAAPKMGMSFGKTLLV